VPLPLRFLAGALGKRPDQCGHDKPQRRETGASRPRRNDDAGCPPTTRVGPEPENTNAKTEIERDDKRVHPSLPTLPGSKPRNPCRRAALSPPRSAGRWRLITKINHQNWPATPPVWLQLSLCFNHFAKSALEDGHVIMGLPPRRRRRWRCRPGSHPPVMTGAVSDAPVPQCLRGRFSLCGRWRD
jgi:hypothetical protein